MRRIGIPASVLILSVSFSACGDDASNEDATTRDSVGNVVDGGDLGVFRLQVGDCLDVDGLTGAEAEGTEVTSFEAIPCDEPHTGEVVLVAHDHFADLDEFTSVSDLADQGAQPCITALNEYTGTDYDTSAFDVIPLVPTAGSWDTIDDRELVCIGVTLNDEMSDVVETSASIRG